MTKRADAQNAGAQDLLAPWRPSRCSNGDGSNFVSQLRRNPAKGNSEAGEGELVAFIVLLVLVWVGSLVYKHLTAPANTTETDKIYSTQRLNKEPYTSSETIQACSDSGCYSVPAMIHHEFERDGTEHKGVEEIRFDNGGYLTFGGAPLPGSGTDQRGRVWTFSQ